MGKITASACPQEVPPLCASVCEHTVLMRWSYTTAPFWLRIFVYSNSVPVGCLQADMEKYKMEVEVLQCYTHPNIVQYLGAQMEAKNFRIFLEVCRVCHCGRTQLIMTSAGVQQHFAPSSIQAKG